MCKLTCNLCAETKDTLTDNGIIGFTNVYLKYLNNTYEHKVLCSDCIVYLWEYFDGGIFDFYVYSNGLRINAEYFISIQLIFNEINTAAKTAFSS